MCLFHNIENNVKYKKNQIETLHVSYLQNIFIYFLYNVEKIQKRRLFFMLTKQEFRALSNEEQAKLVNDELLKNKGTKDFGAEVFEFSYSFARKILVDAGYDTFMHEAEDGTRVRLFRVLTDEEKEAQKQKTVTEDAAEPMETEKQDSPRVIQLAVALRENEKEEDILRKTFPAFESTWAEFDALLKSDDFKIYDKKYIYDLVLRTFLEKYGDVYE